MERVTRALNGELEQLQLFGADWGNWLETYRFMAGEHPLHRRQHDPATVEAARLDVIAYVDADARFVCGRATTPRPTQRDRTRCWVATRSGGAPVPRCDRRRRETRVSC